MSGRPRLVDVARRTGVAVTTASAILNGTEERRRLFSPATIQLVETAAVELGYVQDRSARSLRQGSGRGIGLIIRGRLRDPAYASSLSLVERTMRERGLGLQVQLVEEGNLHQAIRHLMGERVEGILIIGAYRPEELAGAEQAVGLPVELVAGTPFDLPPGIGFHGLRFPEVQGLALRHLEELGHRRVAFLADEPREGITGHPLLQPAWCIPAFLVWPGDAMVICLLSEWVQRWQAAAPGKRPSAVLCHNDLLARILLSLLYQAGIHVPRDLSVIGAGNVPDVEFLAPPLTTVDLHLAQRVESALTALLERHRTTLPPGAPRQFSPDLVVRASTARPGRA